MTRKNVNNMTFAEACAAWYATAEKYAEFGAYDTEPRAEFADIVVDLAQGKTPVVPQKANSSEWRERNWQLYSTMKGSFFAGKALTRAAERVVKVAARSTEAEIQHYAQYQGWYW